MVWDSSTPADTADFHPHVIDAMHTAKEMMRERAVAYNGSTYEHNENTDDNFGKHQPSKVSWLKWHASYAAMVAFLTPIGEFNNTLHFVEDTEAAPELRGLYSVFGDEITKLSAYSHTELEITDVATDHPQYLLRSDIDGVTEEEQDIVQPELTLNCSALTLVEPTEDTLPVSHVALPFAEAHSDTTVEWSDIDDDSVDVNYSMFAPEYTIQNPDSIVDNFVPAGTNMSLTRYDRGAYDYVVYMAYYDSQDVGYS